MLKQLHCGHPAAQCGAFSPPIDAEILEQVLVKVNGDIITKTEFELRQVAELRNRPELANVLAEQPPSYNRRSRKSRRI